jgi:hypothetical protein
LAKIRTDLHVKKSTTVTELNKTDSNFISVRFIANRTHYFLRHLLSNILRIATTFEDLDNKCRNWQTLTELMKDPVANAHLFNVREKPNMQSDKSRIRVSETMTQLSKPMPFPGRPRRQSITTESLRVAPIVNDLIGLQDTRKSSNFQIIPRALPGAAPSLLAKVPEAMGIDLLRLFKIHTKFFCTRSASFRMNVLDLLRPLLGSPIREFFGAELRRYSVTIPVIVFLLDDKFVMLANSTLTPDRHDFLFDVMDLTATRFFIESALIGHWGETTIFASRILV